jgi:hypothetical protein
LLPPLDLLLRGRAKKEMMACRALADMSAWARECAGAVPRSGDAPWDGEGADA